MADGETVTLAELGNRYGLTRERIRQVEALALKAVSVKTKTAEFGDFVRNVSAVLKRGGGLKREDWLTEELGGVSQTNKLKFLLEISGAFYCAGGDRNFYPHWYRAEADKRKALDFINAVVKNAARENFLAGFAKLTGDFGVSGNVARDWASISKKIAINIYGDLGLSEWSEINPKTARHWTYLVLKKEKRPLHFIEIAKAVTALRKQATYAPTVHNELIKDDRFVLVGKGTYTLKEFGVTPGTARELIGHYLRKHGPLKSREVVKMVLQERLFKENTVLINLQNRKHFRRLEDGRYTLLEA